MSGKARKPESKKRGGGEWRLRRRSSARRDPLFKELARELKLRAARARERREERRAQYLREVGRKEEARSHKPE